MIFISNENKNPLTTLNCQRIFGLNSCSVARNTPENGFHAIAGRLVARNWPKSIFDAISTCSVTRNTPENGFRAIAGRLVARSWPKIIFDA
ncbi:MAG TPA: hypothetical protein H9994_02385, partial [Candidatus Salinicoccus merdavium]|nr:hypothetical protein [Candidatus Salinicoccus merdavium]